MQLGNSDSTLIRLKTRCWNGAPRVEATIDEMSEASDDPVSGTLAALLRMRWSPVAKSDLTWPAESKNLGPARITSSA